MPFTKYCSFDVAEVLDIKGARTKREDASLSRVASYDDYRTTDGYMYVRLRAISSRVNKNHDGWPTAELAGGAEILSRHQSSEGGFTVEAAQGNKELGFPTFMGKPNFIDHNNGSPKRTRGVVIDSKFHVLSPKEAALDPYWSSKEVDARHLPAAEIELLIEIDAKSFPIYAAAILNGDLDGFSMGADVERSVCSHCANVASSPEEYCHHIIAKGAHHDLKTASGQRVSKRSYENCEGIHFFEISAVFEPADPTALKRDVIAAIEKEGEGIDPFGPPTDEFGQHRPLNPADHEAIRNQMRGQGVEPGVDGSSFHPEDQRSVGQEFPSGWGGNAAEGPYVRTDAETPGSLMAPHLTINPSELPANMPQMPQGYDPRMSATKTTEAELPQGMLTRAPESIDTLRDEHLCPICGNTMEGETCDVCGYVQPPKGFDNPDLSQAEKIRSEMKEKDQEASDPQAQPGAQPIDASGGQGPAPQGGSPGQGMGQGPLSSQSSTNSRVPDQVKNSMSWQPFVTEKTAARINKVEKPIYPAATVTTNEPTSQVVTSDQSRPVTAAMLTAQRLMATAQRNHTGESMSKRIADATSPGDTAPTTRVDVTGIGGVDQASNEAASKADAQVDVTGIGATGIQNVDADKTETLPTASESSDDSGFNTDKTTEDSGPTKTFGDSDGTEKGITDPVTSNPFPASEDGVKAAKAYHKYLAAKLELQHLGYDDKTLEQNEQQGDPAAKGGTAVKGVQPIAETFGERVNLLEHKTTPDNNSGPTKTWSGTDGNGVLKQQDPVDSHKQEWGGVPVPDVQLHTGKAHFLAAIKLAEAEIELGLPGCTREEKFNRIATLDAQSPEYIEARLAALADVKTAGVAKIAQTRTAGVKVPAGIGHRFERIASDHVAAESQPVTDESLDSGLFLR
jgi:hypothetical protein